MLTLISVGVDGVVGVAAIGTDVVGTGVLCPLLDRSPSLVSASLKLEVLLFSLRRSDTGNGLYSSPLICLS